MLYTTTAPRTNIHYIIVMDSYICRAVDPGFTFRGVSRKKLNKPKELTNLV